MAPSINHLIKDVFGDDVEIIYECRRCGTTASAASDTCDNCGRNSIVRYEIS